MTDDETASTVLRAHKKLLGIYCHDFSSMVDRLKMGEIICSLHS